MASSQTVVSLLFPTEMNKQTCRATHNFPAMFPFVNKVSSWVPLLIEERHDVLADTDSGALLVPGFRRLRLLSCVRVNKSAQ